MNFIKNILPYHYSNLGSSISFSING